MTIQLGVVLIVLAFAAGYGFAHEVRMYRDPAADGRLAEDLALLEDVEVALLEQWYEMPAREPS